MATISKYILLAFMTALVFSSCQPSKKLHQERLYLQGIDTSFVTTVTPPEFVIQKGELLSITVFSDNAEATAIYNQLQTSVGAISSSLTDGSNTGSGRGYLVDVRGNILFHSLGTLHVEGLNKTQLVDLLQQRLDTVLKHPYVEIRFLNKRVTILGEVAKPGVINMPEERLTILDALALSGDMTNFARRDNVLVIREQNGRRTMARLDIKNAAIYTSDYFYLQSGDFIYIEPIRKKPTGTDQTVLRNVSLAATGISILAILYQIFRRN